MQEEVVFALFALAAAFQPLMAGAMALRRLQSKSEQRQKARRS